MTAMFPLQSALLPGETLPLNIFEPRYAQLVRDCVALPDPAFGVVLISRGQEVGGGDTRSEVGALAHITEYADLGDDQYQLLASVGERIRIVDWLPDDPYPRAVVQAWPDEPGPAVGPERISLIVDAILALFGRVIEARGGTLRYAPATSRLYAATRAAMAGSTTDPAGAKRPSPRACQR